MVLTRFKLLKKRLWRESILKKKHEETILGMGMLSYQRKKEEVSKVSNKIWYLPHHWVFYEDKPNKIPTVFDDESQFYGLCLNKTLLTGPECHLFVQIFFGMIMSMRIIQKLIKRLSTSVVERTHHVVGTILWRELKS